jgi:hypothetical protein
MYRNILILDENINNIYPIIMTKRRAILSFDYSISSSLDNLRSPVPITDNVSIQQSQQITTITTKRTKSLVSVSQRKKSVGRIGMAAAVLTVLL